MIVFVGLVRVTRTVLLLTTGYFMSFLMSLICILNRLTMLMMKMAIYLWHPLQKGKFFVSPLRFLNSNQVFVLWWFLWIHSNANFILCVDMCGHFYRSLMGLPNNCFKYVVPFFCNIPSKMLRNLFLFLFFVK